MKRAVRSQIGGRAWRGILGGGKVLHLSAFVVHKGRPLKLVFWSCVGCVVMQQGHKAAAEQLLKCGSNIDATSSRRASSLFMATYYGHVDVTFLLLAWGEHSK